MPAGAAQNYFAMNATPILIAKNSNEIFLLPQMANRHGLIAGATGTCKSSWKIFPRWASPFSWLM